MQRDVLEPEFQARGLVGFAIGDQPRVSIAAVVAFFSIFSQSTGAQKPAAPANANQTQEAQWEEKFRAIPDPNNLREYMRHLSARPHHVGSPYDKDNAEWILAKFKSFGLDAHIENFEVLYPTPKKVALELIAPTRFTARLQEPAVPGDRTSALIADELPPFDFNLKII